MGKFLFDFPVNKVQQNNSQNPISYAIFFLLFLNVKAKAFGMLKVEYRGKNPSIKLLLNFNDNVSNRNVCHKIMFGAFCCCNYI